MAVPVTITTVAGFGIYCSGTAVVITVVNAVVTITPRKRTIQRVATRVLVTVALPCAVT